MAEDIVDIISRLGIDASGVYSEMDKVNAKYKESGVELRKQQDALDELTKREVTLTAARAKSNNPTATIQYNNELDKVKTQIASVTSAIEKQSISLKATTKEANTSAAALTKAFDSTLTKGLNGEILATRSNYIKLRTELANNIGSDRAEHLAVEMGKVKHELDLATESARAFGSENKLKESGVLIEDIAHSILKLDFRGAQSQSKLLADLTKTISFKDVVKSVQQLGSTLANVGEALVKNPLFLLAVTIGAIVEVTSSVIEEFDAYNKVLEENQKALDKVIDGTKELVRSTRDLALENDIAAGKISKSNGEVLKERNKFKDEYVDLAQEEHKQITELQERFVKQQEDRGKVLKAINLATTGAVNTAELKGELQGVINIEKAFAEKRLQLKLKFGEEIRKQDITEAKEELDIIIRLQNEVRSIREKNQLAKFDTKTIDGLKKTAALERQIAAENIAAEIKQNTKNVENSEDVNRIKVLEQQKLSGQIVSINQKEAKDIEAIKKEAHAKVVEENKTVIKDEADLNKSLLELQIQNAELSTNGQVDSYTSKIKVTADYYNALISLTDENSSERTLLEAQLNNELLKLDKDHQKELFTLANDALSEEERHQQVLLGFKKNSKALQLASELSFEQARLLLLQDSGTATEAEIKKQQNKIEELTLQHNEEVKKLNKEQFKEYLADIKTVTDATIAAANKVVEAEINKTDKLISLQQKRVDEAARIADRGNAKLLALEKDRLEKLNKEKEKFVRQQQTLATIELIANTAVTVSKAAAEGGAAAAFTIAAALIALIGGLASARSIAGQAAFFKGGESDGYTGDGSIYDESNKLGAKAYRYHNKEFIFNNEKTTKFIDVFRKVHKGELDLNQMKYESDLYKMLKANGINTNQEIVYRNAESGSREFSDLKESMRDIKRSIDGQSRLKVNIDRNGINMIATEYIKDRKRINSIAG